MLCDSRFKPFTDTIRHFTSFLFNNLAQMYFKLVKWVASRWYDRIAVELCTSIAVSVFGKKRFNTCFVITGDHTRVKLTTKEGGDYINANVIKVRSRLLTSHSLVLSLFIRLSIHSHSFLHLPLCSFVWYCVFHFFARSVRSFDYSFGRSIVRS